MSTTAKGDAFEQRVHDALASELRNERLCASPKSAKIFRKKAYQSRDRGASIITDVSIELFLPDRQRPCLVWIFECKDYAGSIPVGAMEEFHAKLQQIGEDNTKGTFVTSGALQRSALTYAQSKGIGVIRLLPDDQVIIVMEFMTSLSIEKGAEVSWSEFTPPLTTPQYRSTHWFFAAHDGYWFPNWYSLLFHVLRAVRVANQGMRPAAQKPGAG